MKENIEHSFYISIEKNNNTLLMIIFVCCMLGLNVAFKHLRSYRDSAFL